MLPYSYLQNKYSWCYFTIFLLTILIFMMLFYYIHIYLVNVYTSIKSKTYVMRYYGNWHFHSGIRDDLCSYNYFRVYYYYYVYFMSGCEFGPFHRVNLLNMEIEKREVTCHTTWCEVTWHTTWCSFYFWILTSRVHLINTHKSKMYR
jgi:hypothetical protein